MGVNGKLEPCDKMHEHGTLLTVLTERTASIMHTVGGISVLVEHSKNTNEILREMKDDNKRSKLIDRCLVLICAGTVCVSMLMQSANYTGQTVNIKSKQGSLSVGPNNAEAQDDDAR